MAGDMQPPQAGGAPSPDAEQAAPAQERQPGEASKKVADVHSGMTEIMEMLSQNPALKADQAKLQGIMQAYQEFVQGLGQQAGAPEPQEASPQGGVLPAEAGAASVKPAL